METRRRAAPRPVLWLGLALAAGSVAGHSEAFRDAPVAAVLLGALLFAAWPAALRAGVPGSARVWLPVVVALACLRAQSWPGPPPGPAEHSRQGIELGRFRALGPTQGWLEPEGEPGVRRHVELLDPGAPADGERIALARRALRVPWARGLEPGSMAREFPDGTRELLPDEVVRLTAPIGAALARFVAGLRADLGRRLDASLSSRSAGFARAILLGDRSELDAGLADLFTRTGTRHVLAVSGLHVALFAALLPWPIAALIERRLGRRRLAFSVRASSLALFALISGGGSPVLRAAIALAFAALAPLLAGRRGSRGTGRRADALSLWGLALALEVVSDPHAVRSLSVQLSYLATLGIIVGTRPLAARISTAAELVRGRVADPTFGGTGPVRAIRARLVRTAKLGVAASAAAVLATLPVAWSRFGELAPIGVVLTPAIVPLLVATMATGWIACVAPGEGAARAVELAIELLVGVLELADRLPATPLPLPARPDGLVALAVCAAFGALLQPGRRTVRAASLLFGGLLVPWSTAPRDLEVHALDVGHGTAVLVRAPGLPCLVFDAGSRERGRVAAEAVLPQLARWEVGRPIVVLSHDDRDHASGLERLVERHPPQMWAGALPRRIASRLPRDCVLLDTEPGAMRLRAGELELVLVRGARGADNEGSRALALARGDERVLLCGDAEERGLANLLREERLAGPVRVLLFPHHGSDTPWVGALFAATRPEEVWISGPVPELAPELDRRHLTWRATGRDGPLSFRVDTPEAVRGGNRVKRPSPDDLDWRAGSAPIRPLDRGLP